MSHRRNHFVSLAGFWLGGFLFYWWLVAKMQIQQLGAAALAGGAISWALLNIRRYAKLHFNADWRWFNLLLRRLPRKVFTDLGLLARALWHAVRTGNRATGAFVKLDFVPGSTGPKAETRRALVFAAISLPPNSFAVAIEGQRSLLVHQLVFRPKTENEEWPI